MTRLLDRLRGRTSETPTTSEAWLVVGLGNPGPSYAGTRHNVGYLVCDVLAARMGGSWRAHKSGRASVVEGRLGALPGDRAVLARPRSFMNESGGAVAALLSFYKVPPQRIVVVHDELDLPFESVRLKLGGGDNGHNGLKSVRASIGTGEFHRVRLGIGRPTGRQSPADFVLKPFSAAERAVLGVAVERAADAVEMLLRDGLGKAQTTFNS